MIKRVLLFFFTISAACGWAQNSPLSECAELARSQVQDNPDPIAQMEKIDKDTRNCLKGQTFPSFDVTAITKKRYTKKDLEGKVVLLNFWFIACAPCVAEMPMLQQLKETYSEKDFLLLSFTRDEQPEVENFFKEQSASFATIAGCRDLIENSLKMTFGYPTSFFLNRKGQIVYVKTGGPIEEPGLKRTKEEFVKIIEAELKK